MVESTLFKNPIKGAHPKNLQQKSISHFKYPCEFCQEMFDSKMISRASIEKHKMSCKVYGKFFKKHPNEFECLLCSDKQLVRVRMYQHIRNRHFNGMCLVKNSITPKSPEEDEESSKGILKK